VCVFRQRAARSSATLYLHAHRMRPRQSQAGWPRGVRAGEGDAASLPRPDALAISPCSGLGRRSGCIGELQPCSCTCLRLSSYAGPARPIVERPSNVRFGRKTKLNEHQRNAARRRLAEGESARSIGKTMGVHHATVLAAA
jgi:hypothetical protein